METAGKGAERVTYMTPPQEQQTAGPKDDETASVAATETPPKEQEQGVTAGTSRTRKAHTVAGLKVKAKVTNAEAKHFCNGKTNGLLVQHL